MKKSISILSVAVLTLLGASAAMAAAVNVTSTNYNPFVGTQFTVTLRATNIANMGGATVNMAWNNTRANLVSSSLPAMGNGPVAIGTGTFLVVSGAGGSRIADLLPGSPPVNGDFDFAVFTFNAIAAGSMGLLFSDDGGLTSGWFDNTTAEPFAVNYSNALITVQTPIPTAVWLFGSALGLLGWLRRKAT